MGAFASSRQNVAIEEADQNNANNYKYPPRSGGNFFGSHFIMGGERFDTPQPESYLFGENVDLNFLGNRPTAFPYPPPQANEPTKTLKSLVNIRRESVRFVRIASEKANQQRDSIISKNGDQNDGAVLSSIGSDGHLPQPPPPPPCSYNIEFTFDSDAKCAITIYYFCTEDISPTKVTLLPRDGLISETYHYEKGINQYFSQPGHVFNPALIPEDDLIYHTGREQYPVAIHCVVEEGHEDYRQSHTTICVIDHHPETNSYVLRALKQKIFVDGLCYLLQEIYGIENKAVNKSSVDEEDQDDHGSECVICMSETRDTLILPCRHLCLCNSCADSLRYQANNCPICRAPFRALLQIRAVQKGVSTHALHQNTPTGEPTPCDQHLPAGYIAVSLIEALNGPPQFVGKPRINDVDGIDGSVVLSSIGSGDNHKATSPLKPTSGQRRSKSKKSVSTNTNEISTTMMNATSPPAPPPTVVEITNEINASSGKNKQISEKQQQQQQQQQQQRLVGSQDKLQIVNERQNLKVPKVGSKRSGSRNNAVAVDVEADEDSENEKLSPLLSSNNNNINNNKNKGPSMVKQLTMEDVNVPNDSDNDGDHDHNDDDDDDADNDDDDEDKDDDNIDVRIAAANGQQTTGLGSCGSSSGNNAGSIEMVNMEMKSTSLKKQKKKHKRPELSSAQSDNGGGGGDGIGHHRGRSDDSDYYTPEDTQNSILSPLCPDRATLGKNSGIDKLGGLRGNSNNIGTTTGSFKSSNNLTKKNLHKKSTSVGNILNPSNAGNDRGVDHRSIGIGTSIIGGNSKDMKGNVSSLPDMLDSPSVGAVGVAPVNTSASTRSSSDSYSSSSSTKQLLSSSSPATPANTANSSSSAANIIVDDKTPLQNAVNV